MSTYPPNFHTWIHCHLFCSSFILINNRTLRGCIYSTCIHHAWSLIWPIHCSVAIYYCSLPSWIIWVLYFSSIHLTWCAIIYIKTCRYRYIISAESYYPISYWVFDVIVINWKTKYSICCNFWKVYILCYALGYLLTGST